MLRRSDDPCWLPEIECADPAARDALILAKLREQVRYAWERSPFYRRKWEAAGVSPETLRSLDDLARFPVVEKAELRAAQAARPPFGDYLGIEPRDVARIHGTSGTTGRPTVFGVGADDWARIGEAHARILWGAGIRPDDRVLICSFFSLYMGSWGALAGVRAAGRDGFPLRRRRGGADADRRGLGPRSPPDRLLRHAVLCAALRRDGEARGRRPAKPGLPRSSSSPASPARAFPRPDADRGDVRRDLRRHGQHGRDDARG